MLIWEWLIGSVQRHSLMNTHLALHVHDDHCVWSVAHHKVLWVFRKQDHTVDSNVCPCSAAQGFEGIWTFCGLHIPDLWHKNVKHLHSNVKFWSLKNKIRLLKKNKTDSEKKVIGFQSNTSTALCTVSKHLHICWLTGISKSQKAK